MAFWNFGTNEITDNLKKKKKVRQTTWPNWTKICTWNFLILSRVIPKCRWAPRSPLRCLEKLQGARRCFVATSSQGAPSQEAHGWGWWRDGGGGACWVGGINERRGRWSVYRAKIMRWDSEERQSGGHQEHSTDDMGTKIIYFTVNGRPEQAEFPVDCPAQSLKGRRTVRIFKSTSLYWYCTLLYLYCHPVWPQAKSQSLLSKQAWGKYGAGRNNIKSK